MIACLLALVFLAGGPACGGPKSHGGALGRPDSDPDVARVQTPGEKQSRRAPGSSTAKTNGGDRDEILDEDDSRGSAALDVHDPKGSNGSLETGENSIESATSASVEELLAAAEAALAGANEALAAEDTVAYRTGWADALAALRRAEAKLIEDPATFPFLRPAYDKLLADLRDGLAPPAESVVELEASAEELARTPEIPPSNGSIYGMPIDPENPLVAKYVSLFQEGKRRQALEQAFERAGQYRPQIMAEIRARGLPEELWVVPVVESGYKVSAYSRARAVGLWQFMTSTARHYGLVVNEWVDERRDPIKSTQAALIYLEDLYRWFNSWDFALAAYNRGEGGIHRDIERSRIADFMEMAELGATHRETQNHVPQIHAAAIIAKHPEQYGFEIKDVHVPADTVIIDYVVDLEVAATCAGTSESELRDLNPELRTWVTPVLSRDYPAYALKLPHGTADRFRTELAKIEDKTPKRQVLYAVRRGDTLGSISRKFGVSVSSLKRWNHMRSNRIRPGQRLVVMGQKGKKSSKVSEADVAAADPVGAIAMDATGTSSVHTVRRGDTLYTIAKRYNTTIANLKRLNGLGRSGRIFPGQKLRVVESADLPAQNGG
jgi:membrane-bound lytic murein transglycosylase D